MTISIPQTNFNAGELAPSFYAHYDLAKYKNSVRKMRNFICHASGGASNRGGTEYVNEVMYSERKVRLIPFQFSTTQSYVLEFGHQYMRIIKDGGLVANPSTGVIVVVTTGYSEADLPLLKFTQSADVMYLTHPSYPVKKLSRTDHHVWTFQDVTYASKISPPSNFYSTGSGNGKPATVTAVDTEGNESVIATYKSGYTKALVGTGDTLYWTAVTGAKYYNIYKDSTVSSSSAGTFFGWIARTTNTEYTEPSTINPDYAKTPPEEYNPFNGVDNYPGVCSFFEQRLIFGRTNKFPQSIFATRTADYENMNRSTPLRDDDSFKHTMNSKTVNEIRWLVPMNVLLAGTSGSEWRISSGNKTTTITPTSIDMKVQSNWGVSHLQPVVVGNAVLFVDASESIVRDLQYDLNVDGYNGGDLTVLAPHLFRNFQLKDLAYQQHPDSILWFARNDGKLLGLTYYKEHDIYAWHLHNTDGLFENLASITSSAGVVETYMIVKRYINGEWKRYIERFLPRLPVGSDGLAQAEDAYFVDCGLKYSGVPVDELSGLDHLEGKEVVALADGNVVKGLTVVGGSVTLPNEASKICIGLPYVCDLETQNLDAPTQDSPTAMDKKRHVVSVVMQLENTRQVFVGPSADKLDEIPFRADEDYGEATALFSGDKEKSIEPGGERDSRVYIRVTDPVPCTVLSVIAKVEIED